jgi:hypothetical protein
VLPETSKLNDIRQRITDDQKRVLSVVWRRTVLGRVWPHSRVIHHELGTRWVRKVLNGLNGSLIREILDGHHPRYQLTLMGVLLTDEGPEAVWLLSSYLRFLSKRFLDDPCVENVSNNEVEQALNLTEEKSAELSLLISVGMFWSGSARPGGPPWEFGVPRDIDELPEVDNLENYVIARALGQYDPELPVLHDERVSILLARERENRGGPGLPGMLLQTTVEELNETDLSGAARRLEEALEDLVRQPRPDPPGAVQHGMAALESVMRSVSDDNLTFAQLLRRHGARLRIAEPLKAGLEKIWGFASVTARHGREDRVVTIAEAEVSVSVAAAIIRFILRKEREGL